MMRTVQTQLGPTAETLGGWIADDFQSVFWATKLAMVEVTNERLGRHGVHAGQQFLLACLWKEDGLTPGELARRLSLSAPTVTRTTARMEGSGLVERRSDMSDGRLVRVWLTAAGRKLESELNVEMSRVSDIALSGLSTAERSTLTALTTRVHENLERYRAESAGRADDASGSPRADL